MIQLWSAFVSPPPSQTKKTKQKKTNENQNKSKICTKTVRDIVVGATDNVIMRERDNAIDLFSSPTSTSKTVLYLQRGEHPFTTIRLPETLRDIDGF